MKKIALFFCLGLLGLVPEQVFSQEVVDTPDSYISWFSKSTEYERGAAQLSDGRIVLFYHTDSGQDVDFGEIMFADRAAFDRFYELIIPGFQDGVTRHVKIDMGDSFVHLHFSRMLLGSPSLRIRHAFKSSPYVTKTSQVLWRSDIDKLFDKQSQSAYNN